MVSLLIMDNSVESLFSLNLEALAGLNYKCPCGRSHKVDIQVIRMGQGVLDELPILLKAFEAKKLFLIEDQNTFKVAGEKVEDLLQDDFKLSRYIFSEDPLVPNERALGRLLVEIPEDTSLIVGIGSEPLMTWLGS